MWSEKLPFAGYSIVKELTFEAVSRQLSAFSYWSPLTRQLLSKFVLPSAFALSRFGETAFARTLLACLAEARFAWLRFRPGVCGAKAGEYRARTGDLLVANQALSQLS